jgi:type VI secretion system protein ImpF
MARIDEEIRITPSVLDRLLDFEPDVSKEAAKSRSKSLRELKQSVRRDMEWLLNTRRYVDELPETLEETTRSLANYGLPDFTGISTKNTAEQKRLIKEIETAIKTFEPRLIDLKVSVEPIDNTERALKFRIDGRLQIEPSPEPVTFDTVLQLGSGEYMVKEK